jgi:alkanesulfonate monooxygenase SsuD/methylene tetrahydromethanopterin reductase-like flavin-dependent oxidoreductase (luciferase family)
VTSFALRFDLQAMTPEPDARAGRYAAALEMAALADSAGFRTVILHEHHGAESGYLPSALTMAAAVAARTHSIQIRVSALVSSFHDPIRVAEQAAVVDLLSNGRLELVIVNGYVPAEFEAAGVSMTQRVAHTVEMIDVLKQAWTGEPFLFRGRRTQVTPRPIGRGPLLALGGASEQAARRAARLGVGFRPQVQNVWAHYRDEMSALGHGDPGPAEPAFGYVHVAADPTAMWPIIAPYLQFDIAQYTRWAESIDAQRVATPAAQLTALRASGAYRILTPEQLVQALESAPAQTVVTLNPLVGGLPFEYGWECLLLVSKVVLPNLGEATTSAARTSFDR